MMHCELPMKSSRWSEEGAGALKKLLAGIHESSQIVTQIAGASEEQLGAAQNVVAAINSTASQSKLVVGATAEQTKTVQSVLEFRVDNAKARAAGQPCHGGTRYRST